jgi:hypothetical protein
MEFLLVQHRRALHLAIQAMRRGVFNADPKGARMLLATTQDKGRFVRSSDRNKKLCIRNTFGAHQASNCSFIPNQRSLRAAALIAQAKLAT